LPENAPLVCGSLWRREIIEKIQFDLRFLACDVEWILKSRRHNHIVINANELIYLRRIHLNNMSHQKDIKKMGYLDIARRQITERR
jgi:hypothetical protein